MKKMGVTIVCLSLIMLIGGCSSEVADSVTGPEPAICDKGGDEGSGNNLSFPVIWSDGYDLPLRGTYGVDSFAGASTLVSDVLVYHQQDALNEWQAESKDGSGTPVLVDWIDWGDNLESKLWPLRAKIRVETVLFQDLETPMKGYDMYWVSGLGIDEMWGTDGTSHESGQATVYSHNARLTIQKIPDDPAIALVWDRDLHQWVREDGGDLNDPIYNSVVYQTTEGPTSGYSAEINVKGRVIYGMLWDTRVNADGLGSYRLTFSFDTDGPWAMNTFFDEFTQIMEPVEEEEGEKGEPVGGLTYVDSVNNLTYLDTQLVDGTGGGGGGGGNGNGGRRDDDGTGGGGGGNGHGGGH
jgi:hypothetical protein